MKVIIILLVSIKFLLGTSISDVYNMEPKKIESAIEILGVEKFLKISAQAANKTISENGGKITIDSTTDYISCRSNGRFLTYEYQVNKVNLIKLYQKEYDVSYDKVKKVLEETDYIDTKKYVKKDLYSFNKKRFCSIPALKIMLSKDVKFQLVYSFDTGEIIDIQKISYQNCNE